ncbi:hypothetical protein M378DRAFT_794869 [Amanita muscaria Koide BX008]|uniref:Uncharacterized protein n=1 Tax=Amanita muscaria (strain Koide BX008) TaxID=946122 RepID=A0A0C2WL61_AMAMK|nr:hypothetical protein M378DRAFT_794869 [Amanita muscaria Koide BX008]
MSSLVPESTTSVYSGIFGLLWSSSLYPIVAALTTIALSLIFFRRPWESRKEDISRQRQPARDGRNPDISIPGPTSTIPRPQPVDYSPGDERHLDISVQSQAPLTMSEPQFIDKEARDERNPGISIPAQAFSTPRPQPVDHSSRDEGHPGVLVPPRDPPTTSEPQTLGDRDAPNRGATRDGTPAILMVSPTIDHSSMEARNKDGHDIPIPIEMPFITSEHPSMDRGGEGVQNAKAGHGVDPKIPIPTDAPTVATEPYSGIRRDRDTGSEEVPFITMFEASSNFQISNTNINAIGGNATIIRFGDGEFTEIQRNLVCCTYTSRLKHNSIFVDL